METTPSQSHQVENPKRASAHAPVADIADIEQRAHELARGEQWGRAARVLTQAARAEPGDAARWLQIAQWQRQNRQPRVAAQTLRAALRLNRPAPPGRAAKATATARNANPPPARRPPAQTRNAQALSDKERAALWQALAETQLEAQNWNGCTEACDELLRLEPRHHFGREILATALLHSGRVDEAARVMRELLAMSPRDPLHRLKLATLLQLQGHSGESLREFQRVVFSHPDAPFSQEAHEAIDALDNMQIQQILLRAGEHDEFRHWLEREFDSALHENGFHLSDGGRESLRHMIGDGRPDFDPAPPRIH